MAKIEIIGNIGADCKKVECNGSKFYTINVCDNRKIGDHEESIWYACNMNQVSENLQKFLVKGQQVFVRGVPRYRIFDSAKHHCKMVAVDVFVNEIQLVGAAPKQNEQTGEDADEDVNAPF